MWETLMGRLFGRKIIGTEKRNLRRNAVVFGEDLDYVDPKRTYKEISLNTKI